MSRQLASGSSILLLGLFVGCHVPPATTPPPWCEAEGALEADCDGAPCVGAVVIDYKRLEPRGYRVYSTLAGEAVDRAAARELAERYIVDERGALEPDTVDADRAGDFYNCFLGYLSNANQWLVVIHAATGTVLFGEPQLWGDAELRNRDFPLPDGVSDAAALGCSDGASVPERVEGISTGAPHGGALSTPQQAWSVAERLNLTEQLGATRYRAMVISYAPATGEFDAEAADWYVWINRL